MKNQSEVNQYSFRRILAWFANKWAPAKSKILQSNFGRKYPGIAKFISNGWFIFFIFVIAMGSDRSGSGGGYREKSNAGGTSDSRATSAECRYVVKTAESICASLKSSGDQSYVLCVRDQVNANGGVCPRL